MIWRVEVRSARRWLWYCSVRRGGGNTRSQPCRAWKTLMPIADSFFATQRSQPVATVIISRYILNLLSSRQWLLATSLAPAQPSGKPKSRMWSSSTAFSTATQRIWLLFIAGSTDYDVRRLWRISKPGLCLCRHQLVGQQPRVNLYLHCGTHPSSYPNAWRKDLHYAHHERIFSEGLRYNRSPKLPYFVGHVLSDSFKPMLIFSDNSSAIRRPPLTLGSTRAT